MLRHKYEHLSGGKEGNTSAAVKKAMERKVRKDAQKDRKSLDAALGGGSRTDLGPPSRGGSARLAPGGHTPSGPPRKRGRRG